MKILQNIVVAVLISGASLATTSANAQTNSIAAFKENTKTTLVSAIQKYKNANSNEENSKFDVVVTNLRKALADQKQKVADSGSSADSMTKMDNLMNTYNKIIIAQREGKKNVAITEMNSFVSSM